MNILYLAHRIPYPPNKGDKMRSMRQIEHLSKRHRVWCACFLDTPSDRQYVEPLSVYCEAVSAIPLKRARALVRGAMGLAAGRTLTESFYRDPAMDRVLAEWGSTVRFDVVLAFSSGMASHAYQVPAERRVLDLCDLDSQKWLDYAAASRGLRRGLYRLEGRRLAARERAWVQSFDASILITEAEAAPIRESAPPGRIHIVGNGVALPDLDESSDDSSARVTPPGRSVGKTGDVRSKPPTVGFVGVMNYRPNIDAVRWFATACWPGVRAAYPDAVFRIVGRSPARCVRRLGRLPGVEVVGEVEDVATELREFDVSVAPLRIARGLQNKVLEAMAAAKPVVLTVGAAVGIAADDGQALVVADSPEEMTESVVRLLGDPAQRDRIGANARRFVAANHCWEGELRRLELIVTGVIERTAPVRQRTRATLPGVSERTEDQVPVGSV